MDGSRVITLESRIEAMKVQIEECKANLYARQGALAMLLELKAQEDALATLPASDKAQAT